MNMAFLRFKYQLLSLVISNFCFSQNYSKHYTLIDSAYLFNIRGENFNSDSLYNLAFNKYAGFSTDYLFAAKNIYNEDKKLAYKYVTKALIYGEPKISVKIFLKKNKIEFSKRQLNKANRQKKLVKKKINCTQIRFLLFKDQYVRIFNKKNIQRQDSLNFIKLYKLINKDPRYLNRFYVGDKLSSLVEILIIHQKWDYVKTIFPLLLASVENGLINRSLLQMVFDRESMWNQYTFRLSEENEIVAIKNSNYKFVNKKHLYGTNIGQVQYFINGKLTTIPLNPNLTLEDIEKLRKYIYLSTYEVYKKSHPNYYFPTVEEFEKL